MDSVEENLTKVFKGNTNFNNLERMSALKVMINLVTSNVALRHNIKGPSKTPTLACATGLNAIADSYKQIKSNEVKNFY